MSRVTNVVEALHNGDGRWCIDTPMSEFDDPALVVDVRGWFAIPKAFRAAEGPFLRTADRTTGLRRVERPDVAAELPDMTIVGFDEVVDIATLVEAGIALTVRVNGDEEQLPLPDINNGSSTAKRFIDRKEHVMGRLRSVIACPTCHQLLNDGADNTLICKVHGRVGLRQPSHFEVLPHGSTPAELTPPFSAHPYDTEPHEMITRLKDGLILDDGCGLRYDTFDNVANLDISPFPLTDIVGSCGDLPFQDASFDGIISVAVLEHVSDPGHCVEEIARVIKPGGSVYAAVPFLQPYHGYPDHYFNMTRDGMRTLFAPYFEVDDIFTPFGGVPMRTLTWFVDSYLRGLPEGARNELAGLTVGELAVNPDLHLSRPYVTELDAETVRELACANVLLGTRRSG